MPRDPLHILGGIDSLASNPELRFRQPLLRVGIGDLVRGDFSSRGGYLAMRALLSQKARPSAVFVCNDLMAFGALAAAHEAGAAVPGELSVVGYDDIQLAAFSTPPLTTVAQPKHEIGTLAAELLLERLKTSRTEERRVILQPELKLRASSGPYFARET